MKTYEEFVKQFGGHSHEIIEALTKADVIMAVVHGDIFHADDVQCVAELKEFVETHVPAPKEFVIKRTRNLDALLPVPANTFVFIMDVGKQDKIDLENRAVWMDHHQDVAYHYTNGVSMAACGKVFALLYDNLKEPVRKYLIDRYFLPIEAKDNGDKIKGLREHQLVWVHDENPTADTDDKSPEAFDKAFATCVERTQGIFRRKLIAAQTYSDALHEFAVAVSEMRNSEDTKDILVFEKGIPWMDFYFNPGNRDKAKFIVFPHIANGWVLRTIPIAADSFVQSYPLPKTWWKLDGMDLSKVSGIPGANFCHKSGFMAKWDTKEHAIAAAKEAILELEEVGYRAPEVAGPPEYVAVDFDNTITKPGSKYVADPNFRDFDWNPKAIEVLKKFTAHGGHLILNTLRDKLTLPTVVEELEKIGLTFEVVNEQHPHFKELYTSEMSNKIAADFFIDDRSVIDGVVDWNSIDSYINPEELVL